jgi:berberine-like enzyme
VRKAGKAMVDRINAMDYVAVQNGGDVKETSTDPRMLMGQYMKARFLKGISPELIKGLQDGVAKHQLSVTLSTGCGMHGNVKSTDTAFAHRYATHNMLCGTSWKENEDGAAPMKNVREFWAEIEPLLGDVGFYVNDAPAGEVLNNANYRENYSRLVQIKNKYDPGNLFRLNANIIPTAKA